MCEHKFIVIEWETGWYENNKFTQHPPQKHGNISPIKRAIKVMCEECEMIKKINEA